VDPYDLDKEFLDLVSGLKRAGGVLRKPSLPTDLSEGKRERLHVSASEATLTLVWAF
jgi:hypothetical protein